MAAVYLDWDRPFSIIAPSQNYSVPGSLAGEILGYATILEEVVEYEGTVNIRWVVQRVVEAVLSSVFFGLFTVLSLAATYLLCRKGLKRPAIILLLIIAAIYASTMAYWIVVLYGVAHELQVALDNCHFETVTASRLMSGLREAFPDVALPSFGPVSGDVPHTNVDVLWHMQECVGTASLVVNITLGDAIVWWRAWVIWKNNRTVRVLCVVLISATFAAGAIAASDACQRFPGRMVLIAASEEMNVFLTPGALFIGDVWGTAAAILSLITNLTATGLIGYKAWRFKRLLKDLVCRGSATTRVERVLALLIESGVLYCVIWVFVVSYELLSYFTNFREDPPLADRSIFLFGFRYVIQACLVSLIGIYPTLVIILVAVNQAHCDTGFIGKREEGLPAAVSSEAVSKHGPSERVIHIQHGMKPSPNVSASDLTDTSSVIRYNEAGQFARVDAEVYGKTLSDSEGSACVV